MKPIYVFLLFILHSTFAFASPYTDSLIIGLNQAIKNASLYDNNKLARISKLKDSLNLTPTTNLSQLYDINIKLYSEYEYYNYDSAMHFAKKLQQLAVKKANASLLVDAKLKVVFVMLSGGMFKETFDSLKNISVHAAPDSIKAEYYLLNGLAYFNLADFNGDGNYNGDANAYLDSALALWEPGSFKFVYFSAIKFLKRDKPDSALFNLNKLLENKNLTSHQLALASSTIGGIYISKNQESNAIPYLAQASIADIESSTKETLALLSLAGIIYKNGNLEDAVSYIQKANADATQYNAKLRKVQVANLLPLIEGKMINTIKAQKQKLVVFLVLLSTLFFLLAIFSIIIRNQVKKLKAARASLYESNLKQQQINQELVEANALKEKYNEQLKDINKQLSEANELKERYNAQLKDINHQLSEANKIKDEYIGYYFSMDTEVLSRFEKLIGSLDKKIVERKWDEIKFMLKNVDFKKEKDELLKNFDKVFLKLFPNFVVRFNTLFAEEDKIVLREDQLLNTELRIFALMRLGITDNEKIAEILDYSINTIYSKKTKIRSKTIVAKDGFEKKLIEITTLSI